MIRRRATLLTAFFCLNLTACSDVLMQGLSNPRLKNMFEAGKDIVKSQEELTAEQEYYLGRAVSAQILAKYQPNFDPTLTAYVNKVGQTVAGVSDVPETFGGYHFVVVNSSQVNAMSAPSGYVYISSGFLKLLPSEDTLAALIAHEIAHIVKRHGVNAISNANLFSAMSSITKEGISMAATQINAPVDLSQVTEAFSSSVSGVVDKLLTSGFDKKQEYEADEYAASLLLKSGYDVNALRQVLTILNDYQKQSGHEAGGWFSTHPDPQDRIEEVDELKLAPLPVQTAQFAERTQRFTQAAKGH